MQVPGLAHYGNRPGSGGQQGLHPFVVFRFGAFSAGHTEGDDFAVLDKDGTDGSATLQLMDPYPGTTTDAAYRIFVRALGKPGGFMGMTTGFTDENGIDWYSIESVNLTRTKGAEKFTDKTLELTTIYVDMTDDGIDNPVRMSLFDNALYSYFWDYDNSGLKLLQMRIYVN